MQLQRDLLRSEGEVIEQQRLIDNLANDLLRQELHGAELYARQRALERTQREDRRLVEWARLQGERDHLLIFVDGVLTGITRTDRPKKSDLSKPIGSPQVNPLRKFLGRMTVVSAVFLHEESSCEGWLQFLQCSCKRKVPVKDSYCSYCRVPVKDDSCEGLLQLLQGSCERWFLWRITAVTAGFLWRKTVSNLICNFKTIVPNHQISQIQKFRKFRKFRPGVAELAKVYKSSSHDQKKAILDKFLEDRSLKWKFDILEATSFSHYEATEELGVEYGRRRLRWLQLKASTRRWKRTKQFWRSSWKSWWVVTTLTRSWPPRGWSNTSTRLSWTRSATRPKARPPWWDRSQASWCVPKVLPVEMLWSGSKRKAADLLQVNWGAAVRQTKGSCKKILSKTNQLMKKAQKERLKVEANRWAQLVDGSRILQEACMTMGDMVSEAGDTEDDHKKLTELLDKMNQAILAFETLFYELLPAARPSEKVEEATKTEETGKWALELLQRQIYKLIASHRSSGKCERKMKQNVKIAISDKKDSWKGDKRKKHVPEKAIS